MTHHKNDSMSIAVAVTSVKTSTNLFFAILHSTVITYYKKWIPISSPCEVLWIYRENGHYFTHGRGGTGPPYELYFTCSLGKLKKGAPDVHKQRRAHSMCYDTLWWFKIQPVGIWLIEFSNKPFSKIQPPHLIWNKTNQSIWDIMVPSMGKEKNVLRCRVSSRG